LISILLASGASLGSVQHEAEGALQFARTKGYGYLDDLITAQLRFVLTLRGLTPAFGSFDGPDFDEASFERAIEADPARTVRACRYWIRKLQAHYIANDIPSALNAASQAEKTLSSLQLSFNRAEYHFYAALAIAAGLDRVAAGPKDMDALAAHSEQLAAWAADHRGNFSDRASVVAAEIARLEGRELEAECHYVRAIHHAREQGLVQNEAICCELAGRFYARRGFADISKLYLGLARSCYSRWGADGKVRQLDQANPNLGRSLNRYGPMLLQKSLQTSSI
jgi:hypothetical protein